MILAIGIYCLGGFISVINAGKGNTCMGATRSDEIVLPAVVSSAPIVSWGGECPAHHRGVGGLGVWCVFMGYVEVGEDIKNNRMGGYVTGCRVLPSGGRKRGRERNWECCV